MTLIDEFVAYLQVERHYSPRTVIAYERDVNDFADFLNKSGDDDLLAVDAVAVSSYMTELESRQYSPSTSARKVSRLRAFYRYLHQVGKVKENPFALVEGRKVHNRLPQFFYEPEIEELFKAVQGTDALSVRNRALLEVLYGTGMRASECVNLELNQIDMNSRAILVHGKGKIGRAHV